METNKKKKFNVTFYYHTNLSIEVEAENAEQALEIAENLQCGNEYNGEILSRLVQDNDPDVIEI